jgi:FtsP/CotA-like multicopper oxidase with cupredoxin domain
LGSKVGFNENATLPFEPGKTYRLRIVNTSAFAAFFFYIDGHDMTIIEVDGVSSLKILVNPSFVGADFYLCRRLMSSRHLSTW